MVELITFFRLYVISWEVDTIAAWNYWSNLGSNQQVPITAGWKTDTGMQIWRGQNVAFSSAGSFILSCDD